MKPIQKYKEEIIAMLKELEQEHGCIVNSVDITFEQSTVSGVAFEHYNFNINVS